jgi:hypothetical protein
MQIIRTPKKLSGALYKIRPNKIAVAYVGQGWKNLLGGKNHQLGEIVLAPTIGSNPYAVEQIIQNIGIDNVHFLDKLHTKLYIGEGGVLIGSPNLSDNGFGPNGNLEMAVFFEIGEDGDPIDIEKITNIFNKYKAEAHIAYPTSESKIRKLGELHRNWQEAISQGLANEDGVGGVAPSIENWESVLDRIHLIWWAESHDGEYNEVEIAKELPEAAGLNQSQIADLFYEEFEFTDDDDIRVGDWILSWRCKKNFDVSIHFWKDASWTYVDTVIPNGYADPIYSKLAGKKSQLPHSRPPFPFELSKNVQKRILNLLNSGEYPELLGSYSDPWLLGPADLVTPEFIKKV